MSIVTSRTACSTFLQCPRRRWWNFEAPNDGSTGVRGWERKKLAIAPTSGIYTHKIIERVAKGEAPEVVIPSVVTEYKAEAAARSLEVEVADSHDFTIGEQAALIEGLGWAWVGSAWPRITSEYDVIMVEKELVTPLADDVVLQSRCDFVGRRKADGLVFVFNPKTAASCDERWYRNWETDMQLLTETLAVEKALGEQVAGVIVVGLVKGVRVEVDSDLKEIRKDAQGSRRPTFARVNRSPLTFGYKFDGNPPLEPAAYDYVGTTKKGWHKFAVWQEEALKFPGISTGSPIQAWVAWLPPEVVENQFAFVPPIMADHRRIESKRTQIVYIERRIQEGRELVETCIGAADIGTDPDELRTLLDVHFPQNDHACNWPSRCPFYEACWEPGTRDDIASSGLYRPRVPHHVSEEE